MKALRILGWTLGAIVSLPVTVFAVLLYLIVYRAHSWRWSEGCIECIGGRFERRNKKTRKLESVTRIWGRPGAQTWGFAIVHSRERNRENKRLRVHERIHVIQSMLLLSIPYLLIYGLHFCWLFVFVPKKPHASVAHLYRDQAAYDEEPRWRRAYVNIVFERQAYRLDHEYQLRLRPGAWGSALAA